MILYSGFAAVVGLMGLVILIMPVVDRLLADGVENSITENRGILYFTTVILSVLMAPIVVYIMTSFGKINTFRDGLYESLSKD